MVTTGTCVHILREIRIESTHSQAHTLMIAPPVMNKQTNRREKLHFLGGGINLIFFNYHLQHDVHLLSGSWNLNSAQNALRLPL